MTWDDLLRPGNATRYFARDPLPQFDVNSAGYASANAWWLAEFSRIAYRHDRRESLAASGFEELATFASDLTGTGAMLVQSRSVSPFAVLAFRGTEQKIQDFLHDADTWPVPAFGGSVLVHRGFKRALNSVWTAIDAELNRLSCPVFYTGHSLGAALATLAAARRAPRAVYAFGSPRVGDVRFVDRLRNVPVYRIVHGADIVTAVPPEVLGFRHAGEEKRIGNASSRPGVFDMAAVWNQLSAPPPPLADHAPINYVDGV
ncbi:lipase family protein [Povalibacter uvarum]|uniref:lipase family protein n=1 Tax=Povalibacter uvarum TaxID=732238 RepID=UPI002AC350AC|nr:lipase family protein [Povalibacter uvarum]